MQLPNTAAIVTDAGLGPSVRILGKKTHDLKLYATVIQIKAPRNVDFLLELPKTSTGKI